MNDRKTFNVKEVLYIDYQWTTNGFCLEFYSDRYRVRVHLGRWALMAIANKLWKVLRQEKKELDAAERALRAGGEE